jgi:MFS family permease
MAEHPENSMARRLAFYRLAWSGAGIVPPLLCGVLLSRVNWPIAVQAAIGLTLLITGAISFFFFSFLWRPRCPWCRASRAKFSPDESGREYLACPACGRREATGFERS